MYYSRASSKYQLWTPHSFHGYALNSLIILCLHLSLSSRDELGPLVRLRFPSLTLPVNVTMSWPKSTQMLLQPSEKSKKKKNIIHNIYL